MYATFSGGYFQGTREDKGSFLVIPLDLNGAVIDPFPLRHNPAFNFATRIEFLDDVIRSRRARQNTNLEWVQKTQVSVVCDDITWLIECLDVESWSNIRHFRDENAIGSNMGSR